MNPNLKAPTQRTLLKSAAALSLLTFAPGTYGQSSYPDRPIKIIKPLPAGTSADTMARYVADQMSKDLGQPVVVDNRPGASSNIGYRTAAEADADGYTLLYGLLSLILNPQLFNQVPYKLEDFTPVIRLLDVPFVQIPRGGTPEEFAKSLATETENWGRVIKTANLKTE